MSSAMQRAWWQLGILRREPTVSRMPNGCGHTQLAIVRLLTRTLGI
jgi:hypothetical protein